LRVRAAAAVLADKLEGRAAAAAAAVCRAKALQPQTALGGLLFQMGATEEAAPQAVTHHKHIPRRAAAEAARRALETLEDIRTKVAREELRVED